MTTRFNKIPEVTETTVSRGVDVGRPPLRWPSGFYILIYLLDDMIIYNTICSNAFPLFDICYLQLPSGFRYVRSDVTDIS